MLSCLFYKFNPTLWSVLCPDIFIINGRLVSFISSQNAKVCVFMSIINCRMWSAQSVKALVTDLNLRDYFWAGARFLSQSAYRVSGVGEGKLQAEKLFIIPRFRMNVLLTSTHDTILCLQLCMTKNCEGYVPFLMQW